MGCLLNEPLEREAKEQRTPKTGSILTRDWISKITLWIMSVKGRIAQFYSSKSNRVDLLWILAQVGAVS